MRLFLSCLIAALAAGAAHAGPGLQPKDLFALAWASDPQVRPDGGQIAYVRNSGDIMIDRARSSIWLVDPAGGAQRPLVSDERFNLAPRWSPDGKRLAYVAAGGGGGPQLYVLWLDSGKAARVASLTEAPRSIAWSPDGRSIAMTMLVGEDGMRLGPGVDRPEGAQWAEPLRFTGQLAWRADGEGNLKPGFSHLFVVSADGGAPRQLTFGRFNDDGPLSWTPDSKTILYASNHDAGWERDPFESEVMAVDAAGGEPRALTQHKGPDHNAQVSPDGRLVAYTRYDDTGRAYENERLFVMGIDGSNPHAISAGLDRSVVDPRWAPDGRQIYALVEDRGQQKVARFGLDGQMTYAAEGLAGSDLDRPYTGGTFSIGAGGLVAFMQGAPDEPPEVAVARGGPATRLTWLNRDLFAGRTLAKVEPMAVASSFDKAPIDAWIMTPPGFDPNRKYPLILEIHGGPFSAYGPVFSTDDQMYAAAGYVVVYANPRGSTSYGEAFANQIDKNYPSHDYDDLMSVVDAAIARGYVDDKRLYVTGGSGGGALTAWIVGKTGRFAAAVAQKPVINWTSEVLTVDVYAFMGRYWFGKPPWEDPTLYWSHSPLSLVGNVTTPTLVVVGAEDLRTPASEAEQYYQALQLRGVPTGLVKVPGASHHGLAARPSQSAAKTLAILAWFGRYGGVR